jgi:hypothetical protein
VRMTDAKDESPNSVSSAPGPGAEGAGTEAGVRPCE